MYLIQTFVDRTCSRTSWNIHHDIFVFHIAVKALDSKEICFYLLKNLGSAKSYFIHNFEKIFEIEPIIRRIVVLIEAFTNFFYPKNLAPTGPSSRSLLAKASPSIRGGGWGVLCGLTYLHVILVGLPAHLGGTITRTPECRHPRIAPPLASTRNDTRKL